MYVSRDFNALCTELKVQCAVGMDSKTYKLNFLFQNLGEQDRRYLYERVVPRTQPGNGDSSFHAERRFPVDGILL